MYIVQMYKVILKQKIKIFNPLQNSIGTLMTITPVSLCSAKKVKHLYSLLTLTPT